MSQKNHSKNSCGLKIPTVIIACILSATLVIGCGAEGSFEYDNNYGNYDDQRPDPGYIGTFSDTESGFTAEMYLEGAIITGWDRTDSKLIIPEVIGEKQVIGISPLAFMGNRFITAVELPKGLHFIGERSFERCTNLKSVVFKGSVEAGKEPAYIENRAFMDCTALEDLSLPRGLEQIGESAFEGCSKLTKADIPDSVIAMGDFAFSKCENLSEIKLSKGLKTITCSCFSDCSSLKSIEIPENVTSIESEAFAWCTALEEIYIPKSVSYINNDVFLMEDGAQLTIVGEYDSLAQRFAERRDISFRIKGADEVQQKVMITAIASIWGVVLSVLLILFIKYLRKNNETKKQSENQ